MKIPKNLFRLDIPTDHDNLFVSVQMVECKTKDKPTYRRVGILIEDTEDNGCPVVFDEKQTEDLIAALQFALNRLKRKEYGKQNNKKARSSEGCN